MTIYLGLGSNLGDRERHIADALSALDQRGIAITRTASLYETAPKDSPADAPWFLNTVAEAETGLSPDRLIETCLAIEHEAGRVRTEPNAPRNIDIDVLLVSNLTGNLVLTTHALTVPHPRYAERRFVLAPLAEIAPDFVDPVRLVTIRQLLAACTDPDEVQPYPTISRIRA